VGIWGDFRRNSFEFRRGMEGYYFKEICGLFAVDLITNHLEGNATLSMDILGARFAMESSDKKGNFKEKNEHWEKEGTVRGEKRKVGGGTS